MLARDNYSYKKYQKELAKKKKREEKEQRKRAASAPASEQPLALSDGKGALSGQASNDDITVV